MRKFSIFFVFLTCFWQLAFATKEFRVLTEIFSPNKIESQDNLAGLNLRKSEANHYKTLLSVENLPNADCYTLFMKRRGTGNNEFSKRAELTVNQLERERQQIGFKEGFAVVSSRGFFPGEVVDAYIETPWKDQSNITTFIPYPLEAKSKKDDFTVYAELVGFNPTLYSIHFKGCGKETISFESFSGLEHIKHKAISTKGDALVIFPGIVDVTGGECKAVISREGGEKISLMLPWGTDLTPYSIGACDSK